MDQKSIKTIVYNTIIKYIGGEVQKEVDDQTPLVECGIDSMQMVTLIVELEDLFGIEFTADNLNLENFKNIQNLTLTVVQCLYGKHTGEEI